MKDAAYLPSHRGFDRYFGYYSGVMDYWTHGLNGPSPHSGGLDLHQGGRDFNNGSWPAGMLDTPLYNTSGIYSTGLFANVSKRWISSHAKGKPGIPLFLYLAFRGRMCFTSARREGRGQRLEFPGRKLKSHGPHQCPGCHSGDNRFVQAPEEDIERFSSISPQHTCGQWETPQTGECDKAAMRKTVAACVSLVDAGVGTVVDALRDAGMWRDTLFALSTDNGGPTDGAGTRGQSPPPAYRVARAAPPTAPCADNNNMNNYPLRGCKGGYFEGGVRGVGLLHGAGVERPGRVSRVLHHVADWLPTFLTAA
eukprot:gene3572-6895_t